MPDFTLNDGATLRGGSYRIKRFISAGGFGCTYEAMHTGLNRRVAIKEFFVKTFCNRDPQTSQVSVGTDSMTELVDKLKGKFLEEARAVFDLNHPGIVRVTDVFEENGTAYFVMDYIEGESLEQLIERKGRLSEADAMGYIRQVADALAYVHSTKRLHLDIKPANIMVDGNGRAILIDFGVSKQYDEAGSENTSTLLGRTPGYAPIEQLSPKLRDFTPATDIYALGATLYKAVSGNTPPDAADLHITEELSFPADVSASTRSAIEAAMSLKPGDRPQTIADFLALLGSDAQPAKPEAKPDAKTVTASDSTSSTPTKTGSKDKTEVAVSGQEKSSSKKKSIGLGVAIVAVALVAALWLFLPKGHNPKESGLEAAVPADTIVDSLAEVNQSTLAEVASQLVDTNQAEPQPTETTQSQSETPQPQTPESQPPMPQPQQETYNGLKAGATFSTGGLNYKVTANGKVEVAKNDKNKISGHVSIPAKVTYESTTYDVTSIGEEAFYNCESLLSVTIPNSVMSIGYNAFVGCAGLTSVTIPNSVTLIGMSAFAYCKNLSAFYGKYASKDNRCLVVNGTLNSFAPKGLTSYTIPNGVMSIGYLAFSGCSNLISVSIPNSVTSIEQGAFSGCSRLASLTIPSSVKSIDELAFMGCEGLTSVTIPNSVTRIGDGAFSECINLSSFHGKFASSDNRCLVVNGTLNSFAPKGLSSYSIPSSVSSIGEWTFSECRSLTSVTIPNSVTSIGDSAFHGCSGLTSVTIPSSVTSIGDWAFYVCSSLTSVTIPSSVTSIGGWAFYRCSSLTSVKILNPDCKINETAFENTPFAGKTKASEF